jgi:hypothetical protein
MEKVDIEGLIERSYRVVDILPRRVVAGSEGQYFKVEKYYLKRAAEIGQKYVDLLLKLNCYYDMAVGHDGENWEENVEPEKLARMVGECLGDESQEEFFYAYIVSEETLIVIERETTNATVYNAGEGVLTLMEELARGEGLYVWGSEPEKEARG